MKKLYAAYGSNLNTSQMSRRCPDAAIVGTGILHDHVLVFRGGDGAVATVEPSSGDSVPVLLWEISKADEAALDVYEGFPTLYKKEVLEVEFEGEVVAPMVYVMTPGHLAGKPSRLYCNTILEGYQACGFDPAILERALSRSLKLARQERGTAREFDRVQVNAIEAAKETLDIDEEGLSCPHGEITDPGIAPVMGMTLS